MFLSLSTARPSLNLAKFLASLGALPYLISILLDTNISVLSSQILQTDFLLFFSFILFSLLKSSKVLQLNCYFIFFIKSSWQRSMARPALELEKVQSIRYPM